MYKGIHFYEFRKVKKIDEGEGSLRFIYLCLRSEVEEVWLQNMEGGIQNPFVERVQPLRPNYTLH